MLTIVSLASAVCAPLFVCVDNISCKGSIIPSKDGSGTDRTLLGYSILPLYLDERIVDESYTLPICTKLRPHYLLQKDEFETRRTSSTFAVRTRLNSTLYTNDPYLNRFFTKCALPYLQRGEANEDAPTNGVTVSVASSPSSASLSSSHAASSTSSSSNDELLAVMMRKVLRSGVLRRKGGLKSTERWWSLSEGSFIMYKSCAENKIMGWSSVSRATSTMRTYAGGAQGKNPSTAGKVDEENKYSFTIRADGLPSDDSGASSSDTLSVSAFAASGGSSNRLSMTMPSQDLGPLMSPLSMQLPAASPASSIGMQSVGIAGSPQSAITAGGAGAAGAPLPGLVFIPGLDTEFYSPEFTLLSDSEDDMYAWLKCVAHARMARSSVIDSIRAVRESQVELLVQHLPTIMRQLLAVVCAPEAAVSLAIASRPHHSRRCSRWHHS
jgi:hypothetical protein